LTERIFVFRYRTLIEPQNPKTTNHANLRELNFCAQGSISLAFMGFAGLVAP